MREHFEERELPFSADKIFDLVADIESYPEFIPWCSKVRIISRTEKPEGIEIQSEMIVSFKAIKESFHTSALLAKDKSSIKIKYQDQNFRLFRSEWNFYSLNNGSTQIKFHVSFEFKKRLLEMLAGSFFWVASQRIVVAFEKRAHKLYGSSPKTIGLFNR